MAAAAAVATVLDDPFERGQVCDQVFLPAETGDGDDGSGVDALGAIVGAFSSSRNMAACLPRTSLQYMASSMLPMRWSMAEWPGKSPR